MRLKNDFDKLSHKTTSSHNRHKWEIACLTQDIEPDVEPIPLQTCLLSCSHLAEKNHIIYIEEEQKSLWLSTEAAKHTQWILHFCGLSMWSHRLVFLLTLCHPPILPSVYLIVAELHSGCKSWSWNLLKSFCPGRIWTLKLSVDGRVH